MLFIVTGILLVFVVVGVMLFLTFVCLMLICLMSLSKARCFDDDEKKYTTMHGKEEMKRGS